MLIEHPHRAPDATGPVERPVPPRPWTTRSLNRAHAVRWLSVAAAGSLVVGGYVHYCLYRHGYSVIPVIGPGFLIQAISSAVLALALLVPWPELRIRGWHVHPATEVRLGALALSVGTLIAFWLSRRPGGLFNFQERGLEPAPQALIALVAELAALVLLLAALVTAGLRNRPEPRHALTTARPTPAMVRVRHR